jgi:hypothetical protein
LETLPPVRRVADPNRDQRREVTHMKMAEIPAVIPEASTVKTQ